MNEEAIDSSFEFNYNTATPSIIKVIGVGGGGGNAVTHMYKEGIDDVSFVLCNTDNQALLKSPIPHKVQLGKTITEGLGAGSIPERARLAAEESIEEINDLFNDSTKMVFITAGMGGGTGTGAAPVIARVAKEMNILTVGIVTIPFLFEGEPKIRKAIKGVDEMSKYVDALLVINNERLREIYADFSFVNAFGKADDTLSTAAKSIAEIITTDGYINLDFADVNYTLKDGGVAIMSSGFASGEKRVTQAIENALHSPLLKNSDVFGAKKVLFNIYFNPENNGELRMEEMDEVTKFMVKFGSNVEVIWGTAFDNTLGDNVKFTILATGFATSSVTTSSQKKFTESKVQKEVAPIADEPANLDEIYGSDSLKYIEREKARASFAILSVAQMDDDNLLEIIDKSPTYNRDPLFRSKLSDKMDDSKQTSEERENDATEGTIRFY